MLYQKVIFLTVIIGKFGNYSDYWDLVIQNVKYSKTLKKGTNLGGFFDYIHGVSQHQTILSKRLWKYATKWRKNIKNTD